MIRAAGVAKSFGAVRALAGVDLSVERGEAVALWGANGAGKTTLMRCLLGLYPFEGTVEIDGRDVRRDGKAARGAVGFVPQEPALHPHLTVSESLWLVSRLRRLSDPVPRGTALLDRLGLLEHAGRPVGALSGGMKRKAALAMALLPDPPLLVLDEPTADLDAGTRADVLGLLKEAVAGGKTLLFSVHRIAEAISLGERLVVLEGGRVAADGPAAEAAAEAGLLPRLVIDVPGDRAGQAIEVLTAMGAAASRNGAGVVVESAGDAKVEWLAALAEAGIPVRDFRLEDGS